MTRDEMLVLTELNRLCAEAPAFALGFPDRNLRVTDEYAFGFRLLDVAQGVLRHARERTALESGQEGGMGDATGELKRQLGSQHLSGAVIEHDEPHCPEG